MLRSLLSISNVECTRQIQRNLNVPVLFIMQLSEGKVGTSMGIKCRHQLLLDIGIANLIWPITAKNEGCKNRFQHETAAD